MERLDQEPIFLLFFLAALAMASEISCFRCLFLFVMLLSSLLLFEFSQTPGLGEPDKQQRHSCGSMTCKHTFLLIIIGKL